MSRQCMLTTFDNPFDPFEQFTSWNLFDVEKGYNTCCYLARLVNIEEDFTQKEEDEEIERAIDEIIKYDKICRLHLYKKLVRETANS